MNKIAVDFDGTIVTCKEKQIAALEYVLDQRSISSFEYEIFWGLKSSGVSNLEALVLMGINISLAHEISSEWVSIIEDSKFLMADVLISESINTLEKLSNHFEVALVTARKNKGNLLKQIDDLGLGPYLSEVSIVLPGKDACFKKAEFIKFYGSKVMIGDSETDYYASVLSDKVPILVESGQRSPGFLKAISFLNKKCTRHKNLSFAMSKIYEIYC